MNFIFAIIFFMLNTAPAQAERVMLFVSEQKIIKHRFQDVNLTNPSVLKVKPHNGNLHLIAVKSGQSVIKTSNAQIEVIILPSVLRSVAHKINDILDENNNLWPSVKNKKLFIQGKIQSTESWAELSSIKSKHPEHIELNLTSNHHTLVEVKKLIEGELQGKDLFAAKVEIQNKNIILIYSQSSIKNLKEFKKIAQKWGINLEASNVLEIRPMIEIEITIAEIKKNLFRSLGLNLPSQYTASIIPSPDLSSALTSLDKMGIQFNAQLTQGAAKIIANPKLLCRSGETAKFIAGGEIPIKLISSRIAEVQWKKYGVILNISPRADYNKRISTSLTTEISLLDESHVVDGIPGILTNRIETHFDLEEEKTIALSGLVKSELGRGEKGTALLSEIPIIGELFKSKDYKQNKTELLVLVTPRIINTEANKNHKLNKFWEENEKFTLE